MSKIKGNPTQETVPIYIKLFGAFASLLIFVLVTELALRAMDVEIFYKNQFFPINRDIDFPEVYEKDPKLFWRFRTDFATQSKVFSHLSYRINSHGMRGPEIAGPREGVRIVALGNSCTFGWGVHYEDTWVYRLQDILRRELETDNIEIINAGVPGYTSHQGKILFADELLVLDPDLVLVMFGWNDHWKAGQGITDARQQMPHRVILTILNTVSRLKLYKLLRRAVLSLTEKQSRIALDDLSGERRVPAKEFLDNLRSIIRLARGNGTEPVLLAPPIASAEIYFHVAETDLHRLHGRYQRQIASAAQSEGAPMVDLQAAFDRHTDLFDRPKTDPIHFNEKGHIVAASVVADHIIPLLTAE